jgi:MFS family permease
VSLAATGVTGMLMFGATAYLPLFVQGALGGSATNAGLVLTPLSLGWVAAATVGGRLMIRVGYRPLVRVGMVLMAAGIALLLPLGAGSGQGQAEAAMVVLGLGLGAASTAFLVGVQASVPWQLRGAATGQIQFMRTIFGALGVAAVGALFNNAFSHSLQNPPLSSLHVAAGFDPNLLLDPAQRARLGAALPPLQSALADALHLDFLLLLGVGLFGIVLGLLFPRAALQRGREEAQMEMAAAQPEEAVTEAAASGVLRRAD